MTQSANLIAALGLNAAIPFEAKPGLLCVQPAPDRRQTGQIHGMADQLSQLKQAQGWTLIRRTVMVRDQQPPHLSRCPRVWQPMLGLLRCRQSSGRYRRVELVEGEKIPLGQFLITPLPTK